MSIVVCSVGHGARGKGRRARGIGRRAGGRGRRVSGGGDGRSGMGHVSTNELGPCRIKARPIESRQPCPKACLVSRAAENFDNLVSDNAFP